MDPVYKAACLYFIGKLESWKLPKIAEEAVTNGVESPSLEALAGESSRAGIAELGPMFERALSELGVQPPNREQACSITLWYFAEEMLRADADPLMTLTTARKYILDNFDSFKSESETGMFLRLYSELVNIEATDVRHETEAADLLRQRVRSEAACYIEKLSPLLGG